MSLFFCYSLTLLGSLYSLGLFWKNHKLKAEDEACVVLGSKRMYIIH